MNPDIAFPFPFTDLSCHKGLWLFKVESCAVGGSTGAFEGVESLLEEISQYDTWSMICLGILPPLVCGLISPGVS